MINKNIETFYNLLANFRIIPFIENKDDNIKNFIKIIKDKFKDEKCFKNLEKFFNYFNNTWLKKYNIEDWNIYNITLEAYKNNFIDKLFFTNNIVESCKSRLNSDIKKNKTNTVYQFSIEINKIINLYFTSNKYIPPIFTKVKAISKYFIIDNKFSENIHLIDNSMLKNIFKNYKLSNIPNNNIKDIIDINEDSFDISLSSNDMDEDIIQFLKEENTEIIINNNSDNNIINNNIINNKDNINQNNENFFNNITKKRKNDGILINEILNNNNNNNNNNVNVIGNKDLMQFETLMYLYDNFINYITYQKNKYELTLKNIKKNNLDYDIKKFELFITNLNELLTYSINNHLEGKDFPNFYKEVKIKYKTLEDLFNYDTEEDWKNKEIKELNTFELHEFKKKKNVILIKLYKLYKN